MWSREYVIRIWLGDARLAQVTAHWARSFNLAQWLPR